MHFLHWWINPPGVIEKTLPNRSSNVDQAHVTCFDSSSIPRSKIAKHIGFLRDHYLNTPSQRFSPSEKKYTPYFLGHGSPAFMADYCEKTVGHGSTEVYELEEVRGLITGRPVFFCEKGKRRPIYYVDYLCVHKSHRKKDIATKLIATYFYEQRHRVPAVKCCLFKREGRLLNIVPLCTYPSCLVKSSSMQSVATKMKRDTGIGSNVSIEVIPATRWHIVERAIGRLCRGNGCTIVSSPGNLRQLAETKNIFAVAARNREDDEELGVFVYRDLACVHSGERVLSCVAALLQPETSAMVGATVSAEAAVLAVKERKEYGVLCIELLGAYRDIFGLWSKTGYVEEVGPRVPCAYYLYNYGRRPSDAADVTIIL